MTPHLMPYVWATILLSSFASGCSSREAPPEEAAHRFDVTTPLRRDTVVTRSYVGQIRARRHIEVRALESGYLQEVYVDEGQPVHEGDRLFQIQPTLYRAEVARSDAEAQVAEVELQNTQRLHEGDVVSDAELAIAHAHRDRAGAARRAARAHLRFTRLDAPFDGIVGRLLHRKGSLLEEGDPLTELSDNHEMWVYFNVSEVEYLDYQHAHRDEHPEVGLRLANGELFDQTGTIQTIESDFNNETGTIAFRAGFPNPDGLLRHGETGAVLMSRELRNAMLVPQSATFTLLDRRYVFVVDEHDRVHATRIEIGETLPHLFVVTEGLRDDDRILLEGLRRVRDGDRIQPNERSPSEVIEALDLPAE